MTGLTEQLIGDAEAILRREVEKLRGGTSLDRLLAGWLLPSTYGSEANAVVQSVVSQWRAAKQGGTPRSYQLVGALALAASLNSEDSECGNAFNDGLDWAMGASTEVDGTPVGLAADPAAVLAVVTALLRTGDQPRQARMRSWLTSVIEKFEARLGQWERAQLHVAAHLLGEKRHPPMELDSLFCVTRVAVAPHGEPVPPNDSRTIVAAVLEHYAQVDAIGAALLLASLQRTKATVVQSIRADVTTVDDVLALLRGVQRSLRDWTWEEKSRTKTSLPRQWHIDHEYHVQNLLWAVLAPAFPDLTSEDYSRKVGFTQPRADLVIPSLKLVIEAKFARASDSLKETQRQLAQDAAMYFPKGSSCEQMIAFVWDDDARTEEHDTFTKGLEQLDHVAGVVVVNRPAKMRQEAGATIVPSSKSPDQ
jgi:hypothetical protein